MKKSPRNSILRGRDSGNGQFIPVEEARRRKETAEVQRVPLPGKGKK